MSSIKHVCLIFPLVFLLTGCAFYKTSYRGDAKEWSTAVETSRGKIVYQTYLIGDAGASPEDGPSAVLRFLRLELSQAPKASSAIFLGDNIYPGGMPAKEGEGRAEAEHVLRMQTNALKDYPGKPIFLPGNHDWYKYGLDGLDRQKDFLEDELAVDKLWYPHIGCGGPEVLKVHENLALVIIDSQWWLENWNKHPRINEGCEVTNRIEFMRAFEGAIKSNKDRNVLVLMHHPLETYGRHGGYFNARDHFLPVPFLGSVVPFFRASAGTKQDLIHPAMQDLRRQIMEIVKLNGNVTFAAGHEHNLQYIEREGQQFIVSGAASKMAPSGTGEGSLFAHGGRGYARMDLYENGSMWVNFYGVNPEGTKQELLFRHQVKAPLFNSEEEYPRVFPLYESGELTVKRRLLDEAYERGGLGRLILGDHYRSTFSLSTDLPVLDLANYQGGVVPVKQGGGNQTHSLRLEAEDGRQYSMRSLEKDPSTTVGYTLSKSSVITNILADAFTSAHPLSALPVVGLAEAVGVSHANPKIYFVPMQPGLKYYNNDFGDGTYLVEERADDDLWSDAPSFGYAKDIISTPDVLDELRDHHNHVLDHAAMARARAFDILLGDWDRHDDQWRWGVYEEEDGWTTYRPIPRDRDQAFSNYDGLLLAVARLLVPDIRPLGPFKPDPKNIYWTTHGNRFFDATFLAGIDRATWEEQVRLIQTELTDEVIEAAFRSSWPAEVYALDAEKMMKTLRKRRDNLPQIIAEFYVFRAREVEIVGTDKKDRFELEVRAGGDVLVRGFDSKGGGGRDAKRPFYERLFLARETEEIIIYGLAEDDFFVFSGAHQPGMTIRLVGGDGKDEIVQTDTSPERLKRIRYYDFVSEEEKTKWNGVRGVADRRSADPTLNTFSRRRQDRNFNNLSILPSIGVNPDNGLLLSTAIGFTHYGFKKAPFAGKHTIGAQFALDTEAGKLAYTGELTDVFGNKELMLDGVISNNLYTVNFYGFGNETVNTEAENGVDFHRVRQRYARFSPLIGKRLSSASRWYTGPEYLGIQTQRSNDRFIDRIGDALPEETFTWQQFLKLKAGYSYDNLNSAAHPTNGMTFNLEGGYIVSLDNKNIDFPYLNVNLGLIQKVDNRGTLVLAQRIGYHKIFTKDFPYFLAATLGGFGPDANMRGFRRERFSGGSAFYLNNDVRLRLLDSERGSLPFSLGILAGFDLGRVWVERENSTEWHHGYGGGVWISPFKLLTVNVSIFTGDGENTWGSFGTGFFF
ncbi:metallophosphoesterase [Neolewinella persica]|uniref:metallophosphoesterase n=1 Tax=Neolewinella persica TaxID=70998 RepID=UPI0012FC7D6D|nr:metallophosphoesterase [Neolewinella persica]